MNRLVFILAIMHFSWQIAYSQSGWDRQFPATTGTLSSVCFVNENTGYIAGIPNLKTTNGGLNWSIIDTAVIIGGRSVFFVNANTGFIGSGNRIYKTLDGGLTWTYFTVSNNLINTIFFINELTGWAAMGFQFSGKIFKTTNSGTNWYNTLTSTGIGSVHFANIYTGFALGTYGEVYKSMDGGNSWVNYNAGAWGSSCIQATDTNVVYVSYRYGRIRKSTDGGLNWFIQQTGLSTDFWSLYFINSNTGWAVGGYGNPEQVIAGTTNGGTDWTIQMSGNSPRLYDVYFINSMTGWAVGDSGLILKTTNGGVLGFSQINDEIPNDFNLYQNYPNPLNPVTLITFDIPSLVRRGAGVVVLKVYDILGCEVTTLVDEWLSTGTYEVEFNGTNYPSGVYYYMLSAGDYRQSRKLILLK